MEAFYESGKIKVEIPYNRGVVDGIAKEYFESGRLAKEIHYKNGKEMFYKSYFDNDNKQEKKNTLMDIVKTILTDIMQYLELIKILQKMN